MTLTMSGRPLATRGPATVNYRIDGPPHRLLWDDFPRRVRAEFGGEVVLDSTRAKLLHESNLLPQLYVPREDVRGDLLEPTEHTTHCPFKGDAAYESVRVGDRLSENAVWHYPEPVPAASWLQGHVAVYWSGMDAWFDEDEEVIGHVRDPYHRVDAVPTGRHVRVTAGDLVVAETRESVLVSETGLPNRFYVPLSSVRQDALEASDTRTVCPYKGVASYSSLVAGERRIADAAWEYPEPYPAVGRLAGHVCFVADGIETRIDGQPLD